MVVLGVGLRIAQWLGNPSLWLDELQLVRNIAGRSMLELLLQGLDRGQVAPAGFLLPTKAVTLAVGNGELALRAVPVAASILALIVFWRLVRSLLGPVGALVATAAFAMNPLLISLASVVKQYATDALATVIILVALRWLWQHEGSLRRRILVGLGAGAIGFLSIPSIVVAGAAITALLYHSWQSGRLRRKESATYALAPLVVWGTLALGAALWARSLLTPGVAGFMTEWWAQDGAFAPPFTEYPTWVLERWSNAILPGILFRPYVGAGGAVDSFLAPLLNTRAGWAVLLGVAILSAAAIRSLLGFAWTAAILLPFPIALGLARFQVYPMDARTSVFLLPLVFVAAGALSAWLVLAVPRSVPWLRRAIPLLLVLFCTVILIDRPPVYVVHQDREVIRELSLRRSDGEPIFAHAWSRSALAYYGPRFGVHDPVVFGRDAFSVREDLDRLDAFRGEPSLWVLFTHSANRDFLLCHLDEIGVALDHVVFPGGMRHNPASLHRYDLSDEARWASTDAGRAPVTAEAFQGNPPRCRRPSWPTASSPYRQPLLPRSTGASDAASR